MRKGKARMIPKPTDEIQKLPTNTKNIDIDFPLTCNKPILCVYCCHYMFNCIGRTDPSINNRLIGNNGKIRLIMSRL